MCVGGVAAEKSHANDTATSIRSGVYKLLLSVVHEYIHVGPLAQTRTQFHNFTISDVDEVKFQGPYGDHVEETVLFLGGSRYLK